MAGNVLGDTFYRDFEDRHRGSRQLIAQRLAVYLPFVQPLAACYPNLPLLDLGCGRGEWLELLAARQITAYGVDTDPAMLATCQQGGLRALQADALSHLLALPTHSLLAVTGFHIAEHLPFAQLQAVIAQARRVLVPGGLLILETPNPENLLVGAAWFYLDPTHQHPLPHQLLSFLVEHQGFAPVKLLLLQEEPRLAQGGPASLYDVLGNASPDYAILAQSAPAPEVVAQQLAQAFTTNHGIALYALANRYDEQRLVQFNLQAAEAQSARRLAEQASARAEQASTRAEQASTQAQQASAQAQQASTQAEQASTQAQHASTQAQQASTRAEQASAQAKKASAQVAQAIALAQQQRALAEDLAAQLAAVHASASWRITRPLRWLLGLLGHRHDKR